MSKFTPAGVDGVFMGYTSGGPVQQIEPVLINAEGSEIIFPPDGPGSFEINVGALFQEPILLASGKIGPQFAAVLFGKALMIVNGYEFVITGDAEPDADGGSTYPAVFIGMADHAPGADWSYHWYGDFG